MKESNFRNLDDPSFLRRLHRTTLRRIFPTPNAFWLRDTTHQHKTHKTELREVHYPWHPLHRQSIPVRLEQRWKNGLIARCDPHSDVGRRGFDIPVWMLDSAV